MLKRKESLIVVTQTSEIKDAGIGREKDDKQDERNIKL